MSGKQFLANSEVQSAVKQWAKEVVRDTKCIEKEDDYIQNSKKTKNVKKWRKKRYLSVSCLLTTTVV